MSSDPGGQLLQTRILELLLDAGMIIGILVMCWIALAAFALLLQPPLFFDGLSAERIVEQRIFLATLAVVAIAEYPAMLVVVSSGMRSSSAAPEAAARTAFILRLAFCSTVWIYLLVAYFTTRQA